MARTSDEIKQSIVETIAGIDPSVTVSFGPVYDHGIRPISEELSITEAEADHLAQLYSLDFQKTATEDEVTALESNFGQTPDLGDVSEGYCYFYRYTRPQPGEVFTVRVGDLVSNITQEQVVSAVEEGAIEGDNADAFYNATRQVYEVRVKMAAVNPGAEHDLAAFRYIKIQTTVTGFDGVENRDAFSGGSASETTEGRVERVRTTFLGLDKGSIGGLSKIVKDFGRKKILAVAVIQPKDNELFQRRLDTPALDIYVSGKDLRLIDESFEAEGGETEYTLLKQPVYSVTSVKVNNVGVAYTFVRDASIYTFSTKAQDKINLTTPLTAGQTLTVQYNYDKILDDLQTQVFRSDDGRIFDTDILMFWGLDAKFKIHAEITILSSFLESEVYDQVTSALYAAIETGMFGLTYKPYVLRQQLIDQVAGLSDINFRFFTRTDISFFDSEVVELRANELPQIDTANFELDVKK